MKFTNIPNTVEGQTFIKVLKQSLRNTPMGVKVRGRGPRFPREGYSRHSLTGTLPHKFAVEFTVYVQPKPTQRYKRVTVKKVVSVPVEREVTEYVPVPTKWAGSVGR